MTTTTTATRAEHRKQNISRMKQLNRMCNESQMTLAAYARAYVVQRQLAADSLMFFLCRALCVFDYPCMHGTTDVHNITRLELTHFARLACDCVHTAASRF